MSVDSAEENSVETIEPTTVDGSIISLINNDVAGTFEIEHDLLFESTESSSLAPAVAGDHEADECDTYVQPMPPNSVQILKFRTHFFEVIEELRMRRLASRDSEERLKQLLNDKQSLENQCEQSSNKTRQMEEDHELKLTEMRRASEVQLKDLRNQQSKQVSALEASEKEIKSLKDEVKVLKLSKFSHEKQIRELECKLQLQMSSMGSSLQQMSELDSMCKAFCRDMSQFNSEIERLDASVKEAALANEKLRQIVSQQKGIMSDQSSRITQLRQDLTATRSSLGQLQTARERCDTENDQLISSLRLQLHASQEDGKSLTAQLEVKQSELEKSADLLQELHTVVGRYTETMESQESEICRLEREVADSLQSRAGVKKERDDAVNEIKRLQRLNDEHVAQHKLDIEELKSQLQMSEAKCNDLLISKADLEDLNSQWAQKNVDLSSEIEQLKREMNRVRCDMSVQTEAVTFTEQCTQVDVGQTTQWTQCAVDQTDHAVQCTWVDIGQSTQCTQCMIDQTDQSVQAVCAQSPAAVQVASQTSAAAIQTLLAVAEPEERLPSEVCEDKLNAESETSCYQAEEGACIVMSEKEGEVGNSSSASQQVIEIIEDSPSDSASDSASPGEQLQQQEDCSSTRATRAEFTCHDSLPDTLAVHTPVTTGTISAVVERQLPNQYDGGGISQLPAVVQKQFPTTVAHDICQSAILQPSFMMNTQWRSLAATKYVYSFEQRTVLARSLMLKRSSEMNSVSVQQSVDDMSLPSKTQASVTQSSTQTSACIALNTKPVLEVCTTGHVEGSDETAIITGESAALKPFISAVNAREAHVSSGDSSKPSAYWQRSVFTSHADNSSNQSYSTTEQAAVTAENQLTWSALTPSVSLPSDIIQNASLPATDSADVKNSFHLATQSAESAVNESVEQRVHPTTTVAMCGVTSQTTAVEDNKFPADVILLEGDPGKLSRKPEVVGCENVTASTSDQSRAVQGQDDSVTCFTSREAITACADSKADSEQHHDSKEQKAAVLTEVSRLSDCSVTRGRRRPLFVHRGPLMETVTTLGGSDSTLPHHKLHKDSESSTTKLPVMLLDSGQPVSKKAKKMAVRPVLQLTTGSDERRSSDVQNEDSVEDQMSS